MKTKYPGYIVLGAIFGLLLWVGFKPHTFWPHWVLENFLLHSAIEAAGGLIAIVMALMLLFQSEEISEEGKFFPLAIGFMGMGLLDLFHAVALPGKGFVLLHSMAVLVGGLGFGLIWVSRLVSGRYRWNIVWVVIAACASFGILVMLHREMFPQMVQNGKFTTTAAAINLAGGVLFVLGAVNFLSAFYHSGQWRDYLFSLMAVMFAFAGFLFTTSSLWDDMWWFWHFIRLAAYILVLGFLIRQYLTSPQQISQD